MCTGRGSNQGPLGPKSDALTTAPLRHLPDVHDYGQLYITYFDIIIYYMGLKICIYKIAVFILINDSQVG